MVAKKKCDGTAAAAAASSAAGTASGRISGITTVAAAALALGQLNSAALATAVGFELVIVFVQIVGLWLTLNTIYRVEQPPHVTVKSQLALNCPVRHRLAPTSSGHTRDMLSTCSGLVNRCLLVFVRKHSTRAGPLPALRAARMQGVVMASGASLCKYLAARGVAALPRRFRTIPLVRSKPWQCPWLSLPTLTAKGLLGAVTPRLSSVGAPGAGPGSSEFAEEPDVPGGMDGSGVLALVLTVAGGAAAALGAVGVWQVRESTRELPFREGGAGGEAGENGPNGPLCL